jgi:HAD superfamily hydrolase (TIGR01484 family)
MKKLSAFNQNQIQFLFTDIDDTLTDEGKLRANAYEALWRLHESGVRVIPITGRPAGWVEMIARFWPVDGVVGENGGFYFRYIDGKMKRHFSQEKVVFEGHQKRLQELAQDILKQVPGSELSSDQFCRLIDVAIDFCEDVPPLPKESVQKIKSLFEEAGAQAKVSSIHVNGWFGDHDKLTMCKTFLSKEFQLNFEDLQDQIVFVGDSPNDAPMFKEFNHSFGVANVLDFKDELEAHPTYVANKKGGDGFVEVADRILELNSH